MGEEAVKGESFAEYAARMLAPDPVVEPLTAEEIASARRRHRGERRPLRELVASLEAMVDAELEEAYSREFQRGTT